METTITSDNFKTEGLFDDEIDALMNEIADFIFQSSQEWIVKNNSFGVTNQLFGDVTLDKTEKFHKWIQYNAPYSDYVEYGTPPHNIPPGVLDDWCRLKFGLKRKDAERVAFLVARKIAAKGVEEKPFLRPAIAEAEIKF